MSQRGDSGTKKMPSASGKAGIKAEPSCRRHAILPVSMTAALAQKPRKMPKAVQSCQLIVRAPRIDVGLFSAAKIGTVEPLAPMPRPRMRRTTKSVCHECVKPEAMGVAMRIRAVMKIVPRRPKKLLSGSESQQPSAAEARYGAALMTCSAHRGVSKRAAHRRGEADAHR